MVKKIGVGIILAMWVVFAIIGLYYYRQYRQSNIQSEYNRGLAERAIEENTRLKNTLSSIRESVDGIREDTDRIEEINNGTINGIRDCIMQLEEIRKQVYILEKYCDSVNYNIGCNIGD